MTTVVEETHDYVVLVEENVTNTVEVIDESLLVVPADGTTDVVTEQEDVTVIVETESTTIITEGIQGPTGPSGIAGPALQYELLHFIGSGAGPFKTVTGIYDNIIYEGFGINDELYMMWVLPTDLDRTKNVSLIGSFFPLESEVGTDCSWEIHVTAHQHTIPDGYTGIIYATDLVLPETAFIHSQGVAVIDHALYLTPLIDTLHIKLKRVVSSNDPVATRIGVSDIAIRYTDDGKIGAQGPSSLEDAVAKARRVDFEGNYIYKGRAEPGTLDAQALWEIQRIEKVLGLDGKTDYIYTYANGNANEVNIWNDRLTLPYS